MHQPIQDSLEGYLAGVSILKEMLDFHRHLSTCSECRELIEAVAADSR